MDINSKKSKVILVIGMLLVSVFVILLGEACNDKIVSTPKRGSNEIVQEATPKPTANVDETFKGIETDAEYVKLSIVDMSDFDDTMISGAMVKTWIPALVEKNHIGVMVLTYKDDTTQDVIEKAQAEVENEAFKNNSDIDNLSGNNYYDVYYHGYSLGDIHLVDEGLNDINDYTNEQLSDGSFKQYYLCDKGLIKGDNGKLVRNSVDKFSGIVSNDKQFNSMLVLDKDKNVIGIVLTEFSYSQG